MLNDSFSITIRLDLVHGPCLLTSKREVSRCIGDRFNNLTWMSCIVLVKYAKDTFQRKRKVGVT